MVDEKIFPNLRSKIAQFSEDYCKFSAIFFALILFDFQLTRYFENWPNVWHSNMLRFLSEIIPFPNSKHNISKFYVEPRLKIIFSEFD